jgi:hypothetical protein
MRSEDKDLIWPNIFQFPSADGQVESLVWRRHAPKIEDVHRIGCEKQRNDRAKGRANSTYFGAITGNVGDIKTVKSKSGKSFTIVHAPEQGVHHAHLGFSEGSTKADRTELKVEMSRSLLNIAKRPLPRLTLRGVGFTSKDAVS